MAKKSEVGFNPKKFIKGGEEETSHKVTNEIVPVTPTQPAVKKPRKKKESTVVDVIPQTSMSYIQENIPYATAYNETNRQLDGAIQQLDMLTAEVMGDIQQLRASKTVKNKFNYLNDATANAATIINAKIGAIREKNKTINDINHMEISRMKEMKSTMNEEDDNQKIMAMYNAYINTPIGAGPNVLGVPTVQDMMVPGSGLTNIPLGQVQDMAWEQNLDPAQNRMLLQAKGTIETVVMYDNATGNRWFEVIDKNTGIPVPNVEKPNPDSIYEFDLNVRGGYARDINRNISYKLIVVNGGSAPMSEF